MHQAPAADVVLALAHELATSLDPGRTAELIANQLGSLFGASFAATYLLAGDESLALAGSTDSAPGLEGRSAPEVVLRALAARGLVDAQARELAELHALGALCGEAIAVPIATPDEALGVLLVAMPTGAALNGGRPLLGSVADLAATSLANGRRFALTHAEARRDELTGLANHRAFHEHLDSLLRQARVHGEEVALVLFDLDDFKAVNDSEGHPEGDRVLRQVARVALRGVRAGEEVFRLGGDEFAVAVEGGRAAGLRVAERLQKAVRSAQRPGVLPTLSAGVAAFPEDGGTKDDLVHKADVALYAAKRAGKDLAVAYGIDLHRGRLRAEVRQAELRERMTDEDVRGRVVDELSAVTAAVAAIAAESDRRAMLDTTCRELTAMLGATCCMISRLEDGVLRDEAEYWPSPYTHLEGYEYLLADYPLTAAVIETKTSRVVSLSDADVDESEAFVLRELDLHTVLIVPLHVAGKACGIVEVYDASPRSFTTADVSLAELVVGQTAALLGQFEQGEASERLYRETLASLANALETKDTQTSDHAQEVVRLAVDVAARLGLTGEQLDAVELGALLHDVGKLQVPDSILNKRGPLTDREREIMEGHTEAGERILAPITSLKAVLPVVRSSHERWDGDGYPDRLAGDSIPIGARIVAVCDSFCAMTESRPYRPPRARRQAIHELRVNAGRQFDPECIEALLSVLEEREQRPSPRLHRPTHLANA